MRKALLALLIAVPAAAQNTSGAGFPPFACSANYLNQTYSDTTNNLSYKCANVTGVGYTWQMNGSPIFPVTADPTGNSCTNGFPLLERISTGVVYSCQSSVYGAINGGSSGSGTVNSGTTGQIAYYAGNGTAVSGAASSQVLYGAYIPSGLIAWYPLTEATGTAPVDISGNGNNATLPGGSNNPTGSSVGLQFTGTSNQWFSLPDAVGKNGLTYVAHICRYPWSLSTGIPYANPTLINSSAAGGLWLGLNGTTGINDAWVMSEGLNSDGAPRTRTHNIIGTGMGQGGCHVVSWEIGGTDQLFVDGVEQPYAAQGSSSAGLSLGGIQVGGSSQQFQAYWVGILRDLYVFNRKLTTAEQTAFVPVATNIAQSQGLPQYPSKNGSTPVIVAIGDSITYGIGTGVTTPYCAQLTANDSAACVNKGVPGSTMAAMQGTAQSLYLPNLNSGTYETVSVFGCTNDAASSGNGDLTAAQCFGATQQLTRTICNQGYKVIVIPMLSRQFNSTVLDSYKDTLDTLYNANWQNMCPAGMIQYISPTDANLWADGAYANSTYFTADHSHPTQTGQNLLGTYYSNAYNKLWGSNSTSWNTTAAATYTIAAADSYLIVTASSTLTLPSCKGYSGAFTIKVNPGTTVTLKTAAAAETIDGTNYSSSGLALTAGSTNAVTVVPAAPATATCTWTKSL